MKLEDSETFKNLAAAFAAECQARARYEYIEYGARYNGYKALAAIVDKIAYQEFTHSRMLYAALQKSGLKQIDNIDISGGFPFKEKWDVCENLRLAADDEKQDSKAYEKYIKVAKKEGFTDEAELMEKIKKIELQHSAIFLELHNQMKEKTMYKKEKSTKWVCPECGYEHSGSEAPTKCPLCQAEQGVFRIILPSKYTL